MGFLGLPFLMGYLLSDMPMIAISFYIVQLFMIQHTRKKTEKGWRQTLSGSVAGSFFSQLIEGFQKKVTEP
jgi:hypothetical protein